MLHCSTSGILMCIFMHCIASSTPLLSLRMQVGTWQDIRSKLRQGGRIIANLGSHRSGIQPVFTAFEGGLFWLKALPKACFNSKWHLSRKATSMELCLSMGARRFGRVIAGLVVGRIHKRGRFHLTPRKVLPGASSFSPNEPKWWNPANNHK